MKLEVCGLGHAGLVCAAGLARPVGHVFADGAMFKRGRVGHGIYVEVFLFFARYPITDERERTYASKVYLLRNCPKGQLHAANG